MAHDLHQLLEEVTDEASFLRFVQARSEDRDRSANPWHRCASILFAGKYYE